MVGIDNLADFLSIFQTKPNMFPLFARVQAGIFCQFC